MQHYYVLTAASGAEQEQQRRHREAGTDERHSVLAARHGCCRRRCPVTVLPVQQQAEVGGRYMCGFREAKEGAERCGVDRPCMDLQSVGETLKLKAGRAAHRERGKRDGSAAVAVAVAVADDDARLLMHGVCSPGRPVSAFAFRRN